MNHYELAASVIADEIRVWGKIPYGSVRVRTLEILARRLAEAFADDDQSFSVNTFLADCGLTA